MLLFDVWIWEFLSQWDNERCLLVDWRIYKEIIIGCCMFFGKSTKMAFWWVRCVWSCNAILRTNCKRTNTVDRKAHDRGLIGTLSSLYLLGYYTALSSEVHRPAKAKIASMAPTPCNRRKNEEEKMNCIHAEPTSSQGYRYINANFSVFCASGAERLRRTLSKHLDVTQNASANKCKCGFRF